MILYNNQHALRFPWFYHSNFLLFFCSTAYVFHVLCDENSKCWLLKLPVAIFFFVAVFCFCLSLKVNSYRTHKLYINLLTILSCNRMLSVNFTTYHLLFCAFMLVRVYAVMLFWRFAKRNHETRNKRIHTKKNDIHKTN